MIIDIERLPMVALRGLVVFPYTVVNFEVAREISIEALTRAMNGDHQAFPRYAKGHARRNAYGG